MGRGPVHLPTQTVGFCRSREAKGRANRSFLEHDGNRDAIPYALCGREIRCVHVGGNRDSGTLTVPQQSPSPLQDADAVERTPSATPYFPNPCVA